MTPTRISPARMTWISMTAATAALTAMLLAAGGCTSGLFPSDQPRSPYDRYRTLRGEDRPHTYQQHGGPRSRQPALRERLRPLEYYD